MGLGDSSSYYGFPCSECKLIFKLNIRMIKALQRLLIMVSNQQWGVAESPCNSLPNTYQLAFPVILPCCIYMYPPPPHTHVHVFQNRFHNWVQTCMALWQARSPTLHKESYPIEGWEGRILTYDINWALQSLAHSKKAASKHMMALWNLMCAQCPRGRPGWPRGFWPRPVEDKPLLFL